MADNKTGADKIHKRMPSIYKTKENTNWSAIIGALGEADTALLDLIQEVRKQFTVSTASRPYIDRLGSNVKVSRPAFVGMSDASFRQLIPVVSYQPKQVKLVMDLLLDLFFFKEATTAFTQSTLSETFVLKDGWALEWITDGVNEERIVFSVDDFGDIANATADEIVASINRQAENSFAIVYDDRIADEKYIRLFSNTAGSKGSIEISGGLANIGFKFIGFIDTAGSAADTVWNIDKVGDTITYTHIGGGSPNLQNIEAGNLAFIDIPGNEGSFTVESIDLSAGSFTITNLFGVDLVFDHSTDSSTVVEFSVQEKFVIFKNDTRALVWEVSPGEIIVEMPASPRVVQRELIGGAHVNGLVKTITGIDSATSLTLDSATDWPAAGGKFVIQELREIQTHILTGTEDRIETEQFNTRYDAANTFVYTGKSGNTLTGITPDIPATSELFEATIDTAVRDISNIVTVTTTTDHGFSVGENVGIINSASSVTTLGIAVDILTTDSTTVIAQKTAAVLDTLPYFGAASLGPITTVTDNSLIDVTDAADTDADTTITVTQQGIVSVQPEITDIDFSTTSAANLDLTGVGGVGKHFAISTDSDRIRYHVWYRVTDGNNQIDPAVTPSVNGSHIIISTPTATTFTYEQLGTSGTSTGGDARVERYGMAASGSMASLSSVMLSSGILGPYMWDNEATFVLSSLTSNIVNQIFAGKSVKQLEIVVPNNIPDEEGFVIFDFGTETQEGPVRYLYKPTDGSLQLDPSYVFKNNHASGSGITAIRKKGAHIMSGLGAEYPLYITDPAVARIVLQNLLLDVKSVGIFIEFLVRYPVQLYSVLDVYKSCRDGLYPVDEDAAAICLV